MRTIYKINHWLLFVAFLGLLSTSLAAEFFFSKEAIMDSFKFSFAELNMEVPPVDQLFIARIERRDTWDWHFWIGVVFTLSLIASFFRKKEKRKSNLTSLSIIGIYNAGAILFITGLIMFLRLYFQLEEDAFAVLKIIHNYSKWIFIILIIIHIYSIISLENGEHKGIISSMFRASSIAIFFVLTINTNMNAEEVERDKWLKDSNYIEGMLYLDGKKGLNVILKEISNCPYEKCRKSDVSEDNILSTITIEVHKPDYKKAVQKLHEASKNGNFLAADKMVEFLIKRVTYKSSNPDEYILEMLKEDLDIDYSKYKEIMSVAIETGTKSKGCSSSFIGGEIYEKGYMGMKKETNKAKNFYKTAIEYCPENSMYKLLAKKKYDAIK